MNEQLRILSLNDDIVIIWIENDMIVVVLWYIDEFYWFPWSYSVNCVLFHCYHIIMHIDRWWWYEVKDEIQMKWDNRFFIMSLLVLRNSLFVSRILKKESLVDIMVFDLFINETCMIHFGETKLIVNYSNIVRKLMEKR